MARPTDRPWQGRRSDQGLDSFASGRSECNRTKSASRRQRRQGKTMSRFTLIFILVLMTGSSARGQFAGGGFDGSSFNALYTETFGQFNGGVKDGATLFAMLSSHPGIFHGGTESGFHSALYDSESNIGFNGGLGRGSITSTYLTDQLSPMTKGGTSDGSDQLIIRTLIWTRRYQHQLE